MIQSLQDAVARILIIDDEVEIGTMIQDALECHQMDCDVLSDSRELEQRVRSRHYDVVISDVCMPHMTGLDLMEQVHRYTPDTRIILMTGHRRTDWTAAAFRGGAFDYIEKPFDLSALYDTVHRALQDRRADQNDHDPRSDAWRHLFLLLDHERCVCYASDRFAPLTGINPANFIGRPIGELVTVLQTNNAPLLDEQRLNRLFANASGRRAFRGIINAQGENPFEAEISLQQITLNQQAAFFVKIIDLSAQQSDPGDVNRPPGRFGKTEIDPLTRLPNHLAFQNQLQVMRRQCRRENREISIIILDVKDFSRINEAIGHSRGDDVICELGCHIRQAVRLSDFVSRFGGNQFGLILPDIKGAALEVMSERLCRKLEKANIEVGGHPVPLQIYAGAVECDGSSIESQAELIRRATDALSCAKKSSGRRAIMWVSSLKQTTSIDTTGASAVSPAGDDARVAESLRAAYLQMSRSLVAAVEAKDPYTKNHSMNVADYAERIARMMDQDEYAVDMVRCAATFHDIGKIGIPDAILTKPTSLTDEEFEFIKRHATIGEDILGQCEFFSSEATLVRHHHERWDGRGYPDGLGGADIPLGSRIITVCDAVDCMFNIRSYKQGFNLDQVLGELQRNSGTQFDPDIATLMIRFLKENTEQIHYPPAHQEPICS